MSHRMEPMSNVDLINPFSTRTQISCTHLAGRRQLLFLTNCSDDSKLYMICVALKGLSESHRVSWTPGRRGVADVCVCPSEGLSEPT